MEKAKQTSHEYVNKSDSDQSLQKQTHIGVQFEEISQKKGRRRIIIAISAIFALLIMVAIIMIIQIKVRSRMNLTSDQAITQYSNLAEHEKTYTSSYWGFRVKVPDGFDALQVSDGVMIANYPIADRSLTYNQTNSELLVDISVVDRAFSPSLFLSSMKKEKYSTSIIEGNTVEIYKVEDPYPSRSPHTFLAVETTHDGYTYRFGAYQSTSIHINAFFAILNSLQFIPRDEYLSSQQTELPGKNLYQNSRYGFAFQYPESLKLTESSTDTLILSQNDSNSISAKLLWRKTLPKDIENDIVSEVSLECAADGPTGSVSCPADRMTVRSFVSQHAAEGLLIERLQIHEWYNPKSEQDNTIEEVKQTVAGFSLPLQEYFAVVFFPPPYQEVPEFNSYILEIANTFEFLQKKSN